MACHLIFIAPEYLASPCQAEAARGRDFSTEKDPLRDLGICSQPLAPHSTEAKACWIAPVMSGSGRRAKISSEMKGPRLRPAYAFLCCRGHGHCPIKPPERALRREYLGRSGGPQSHGAPSAAQVGLLSSVGVETRMAPGSSASRGGGGRGTPSTVDTTCATSDYSDCLTG